MSIVYFKTNSKSKSDSVEYKSPIHNAARGLSFPAAKMMNFVMARAGYHSYQKKIAPLDPAPERQAVYKMPKR